MLNKSEFEVETTLSTALNVSTRPRQQSRMQSKENINDQPVFHQCSITKCQRLHMTLRCEGTQINTNESYPDA